MTDSPANGARVLVTGAAGFIGTNVVERLSAAGVPALGMDIVPARRPAAAPLSMCDVRDERALRELVAEFGPTDVFHLAARTDLGGRTLNDYDSNTDGV